MQPGGSQELSNDEVAFLAQRTAFATVKKRNNNPSSDATSSADSESTKLLRMLLSGEVPPDLKLTERNLLFNFASEIAYARSSVLDFFKTLALTPDKAFNSNSETSATLAGLTVETSNGTKPVKDNLTKIQYIARWFHQALKETNPFYYFFVPHLQNDLLNSALEKARSCLQFESHVDKNIVGSVLEKTRKQVIDNWLHELNPVFKAIAAASDLNSLEDVFSRLLEETRVKVTELSHGLEKVQLETTAQEAKSQMAVVESALSSTGEQTETKSTTDSTSSTAPQTPQKPKPAKSPTLQDINTPTKKKLARTKIHVNAVDEEGNTLIHYAVINNDQGLFHLLLSHGAKLDVCNKKGQTPLDVVEAEKIKVLLNSQDPNTGNTALHWAVRNGQQRSFYLSYHRGASVSVKNRQQQTPLDVTDSDGDNIFRLAMKKIEKNDEIFSHPKFVQSLIDLTTSEPEEFKDAKKASVTLTPTPTARRSLSASLLPDFSSSATATTASAVESKTATPLKIDVTSPTSPPLDLASPISAGRPTKSRSSRSSMSGSIGTASAQKFKPIITLERLHNTWLRKNTVKESNDEQVATSRGNVSSESAISMLSQLLINQYSELARFQAREIVVNQRFDELERALFKKLNSRWITQNGKKILRDKLDEINKAKFRLLNGDDATKVKVALQQSTIIQKKRSALKSDTLTAIAKLNIAMPLPETMTLATANNAIITVPTSQKPGFIPTDNVTGKLPLHYWVEQGQITEIAGWTNTLRQGYRAEEAGWLFTADDANRNPVQLGVAKANEIRAMIDQQKKSFEIRCHNRFALIIAHLKDEMCNYELNSKEWVRYNDKLNVVLQNQKRIAEGTLTIEKALEVIVNHGKIRTTRHFYTRKSKTVELVELALQEEKALPPQLRAAG